LNLFLRSQEFYIGGRWVSPQPGYSTHRVINPMTEEPLGEIALGTVKDVDVAVQTARTAFERFSQTRTSERIALLDRILESYNRRISEFADAIALEIGAPLKFAREGQAFRGTAHLRAAREALALMETERRVADTLIAYEPIGVCGLITPWNWPMNQLAVKVAPAIAAGCLMVVKPSEFSPLSALLFAEVMEEAGTPPGVFNLINGSGAVVGNALATHPNIAMISFTGSTASGIRVAEAAASSVKRVSQELGGKSANVVLPDADLESAVAKCVVSCFVNSGQSCSIPTRLFVSRPDAQKSYEIAKQAAEGFYSGPNTTNAQALGPLVNVQQFERVQNLIRSGIEQGARLITGGLGRPDGVDKGYFVKPTVFGDVTPDMRIAQEEIFGPVLSILPYEDEDHAVAMANGTDYGLAAYVQSKDLDHARRVARRLRAGGVHINYPPANFAAPFGGYKKSGNGREWGAYGVREFMEVKSIVGYH
jgi:aldehyde dehydrogenase (NAD+)